MKGGSGKCRRGRSSKPTEIGKGPNDAAPTEPAEAAPLGREERLARDRDRLLSALAAGRTIGIQERVAWILSTQPNTRDSDAALQLAYWQEYEPEVYEAGLAFSGATTTDAS